MLKKSCILSRQQGGFTLIELVTVIMIVGIVSVAVLPRFFDRNTFDSRGFYDQSLSTLRYAQKQAIAQHGFVCVAFSINSITLTTGKTAGCGSNLAGPDGVSPYTVSSNQSSFAAIPAAFNFNALGKPGFAAQMSITVVGVSNPILIEAETGYVH